jgi:hypothetical protein
VPRSRRRKGTRPGKTQRQIAAAKYTQWKRERQARAKQLRDQREAERQKHIADLSARALITPRNQEER